MLNRKYNATIIFILLLAVIAVVSGCRKQEVKEPVVQNNVVQENNDQKAEKKATTTENVSTATEEVNTSNWLTYQNKKYGYKIKYPADWELIKISDDLFVGFTPPDMKRVKGYYNRDVDIFVRKNPEKLSIKEFYNGKSGINFYQDAVDGYESIVVDGQSAVKFKGVIGMLTRDIIVISLADNFFIELAVDKHEDIFYQMLSTFEFLKQ